MYTGARAAGDERNKQYTVDAVGAVGTVPVCEGQVGSNGALSNEQVG